MRAVAKHADLPFQGPEIMPVLKSPPAHKIPASRHRCAATGMRMTEQRRVIARVLADSVDHPRTAWTVAIHGRDRDLSSTATQRR